MCVYVSIHMICDVSVQKLRRRIRTFSVDFQKHLEVTHCNIPIIVTKCINELDERGLLHNTISVFSSGDSIHTCRIECQGDLQAIRG